MMLLVLHSSHQRIERPSGAGTVEVLASLVLKGLASLSKDLLAPAIGTCWRPIRIVSAPTSEAFRSRRAKKLLMPLDEPLARGLDVFKRTALDRQAEILYIWRVLPGHVRANDGL